MRADADVMSAAPETADDLVGRLRQRRSAARVASAYAAAHGHPVGADADGTGRRWALGARPGVVAVVAVLLLAGVAAAVALGWDTLGSGGVRPIASAGAAGDGNGGTAGEAGHDGGSGPAGGRAEPGGGGPGDGGPGPGGVETAGDVRTQGTAGAGVVAHVVGAVREPGLVELPGGARIADAVAAAGGPTNDADLSGVNLARPVADGEQIHVPRPGEAPVASPAAGGDAPAATDAGGGATVDLNTADAATLETLPGIGPALAQRIIDWRATHGPFATVDELDDVSGIGPAVLEQIRPAARV
ncbi:ComEA family DNA-binding protein [Myceligenerans pegani]|uniref:ComEA family DNA-binding protein n=1 Tax=Myceligenerans pegani TaxID=2776917 RepID=A0ABR9N251_9MICO|nr:ComEA family DNA-binding protein [Myceligenerans sp. TRM 65318]MBE1877740.1 ComEA family DNA-binding protein [Myceligenerans sp. TRM 65318]MBE3020011.1 ComEA family DNA-binding protein [Myceligenerans sp. TRM 65318]